MIEKIFLPASIATAMIGFGILVFTTMNNSKATEHFREVCVKQGGTPAYNGQRWECLK
jgi:hypothetical protein